VYQQKPINRNQKARFENNGTNTSNSPQNHDEEAITLRTNKYVKGKEEINAKKSARSIPDRNRS
jgi:hypothetical protein